LITVPSHINASIQGIITMTTIRFAGLELCFLQDRHRTNGGIDLFTTIAQPKAGMPIPHYHESWDETVYGLSGTTTWTIAGREVLLNPGGSAFIPRGVVHSFANRSDDSACFLSILTPGVLGPEYFQATAGLVNAGNAEPKAIKALMLRYGLVPVQVA
jgi:mannose-6-phosphate isomerase-like protein (cupin superfamily)